MPSEADLYCWFIVVAEGFLPVVHDAEVVIGVTPRRVFIYGSFLELVFESVGDIFLQNSDVPVSVRPGLKGNCAGQIYLLLVF